jgi:hypothetical protein
VQQQNRNHNGHNAEYNVKIQFSKTVLDFKTLVATQNIALSLYNIKCFLKYGVSFNFLHMELKIKHKNLNVYFYFEGFVKMFYYKMGFTAARVLKTAVARVNPTLN